jgi:xanthine dehydrogenase accessory factor
VQDSPRSEEQPKMMELAAQVRDWQRAARPVSLVRVVSTRGFSSRDRSAIAAFTAGQPAVGSVLSGAVDAKLAARLGAVPQLRAVFDIGVSDDEAMGVGLSCGGSARVLVQPASDIDESGWADIATGAPACLVTVLDAAVAGDSTVGASAVFTAATIDDAEARFGPGVRRMFNRGANQTALFESPDAAAVITALWPVPTLVVVGHGVIANALAAAARLLEWTSSIVNTADAATTAISGLTHADAVVVLSHDRDVDGPAMQTALTGQAGYVGGLGSAHTQAARAQWLVERGVEADVIAGIHGPAGLDIGAYTPAEIATAITAEIIAVRSGAGGGSLQGRLGPIRPS